MLVGRFDALRRAAGDTDNIVLTPRVSTEAMLRLN
jgi:hypothetical protein